MNINDQNQSLLGYELNCQISSMISCMRSIPISRLLSLRLLFLSESPWSLKFSFSDQKHESSSSMGSMKASALFLCLLRARFVTSPRMSSSLTKLVWILSYCWSTASFIVTIWFLVSVVDGCPSCETIFYILESVLVSCPKKKRWGSQSTSPTLETSSSVLRTLPPIM